MASNRWDKTPTTDFSARCYTVFRRAKPIEPNYLSVRLLA
jgi:hypothetical protein